MFSHDLKLKELKDMDSLKPNNYIFAQYYCVKAIHIAKI